jgi:uncharacterized FlgJ-related protein
MRNNDLLEPVKWLIIIVICLFSVSYVNNTRLDIAEKSHQIDLLTMENALLNAEMKLEELEDYKDSVELHQLNWNNIDYWLDAYKVEHKEIVKHQIFLETGNLSSDICHTNNNIFGMRFPRVRKTTAIGSRKGFATYSNYVDSIRDYAIWQDTMYEGEHDYYVFLDNVGYCEGDSYINRLKYIDKNVTI